ncbi:MAG: MazG-like family protein [Longimicrobiales bacterium]|nr:MazG-like family protein [Longimicrobiales bacterium]
MPTLTTLTSEVLAFRDERDWAQFHTPRNLAAALAIEAAELQEEFLWKEDAEIAEYLASKPGHRAVSDEIADVVIYALLFAHASGIDLGAAVRKKLEKNREKYPVERARGSARKYTELGDAAE